MYLKINVRDIEKTDTEMEKDPFYENLEMF